MMDSTTHEPGEVKPPPESESANDFVKLAEEKSFSSANEPTKNKENSPQNKEKNPQFWEERKAAFRNEMLMLLQNYRLKAGLSEEEFNLLCEDMDGEWHDLEVAENRRLDDEIEAAMETEKPSAEEREKPSSEEEKKEKELKEARKAKEKEGRFKDPNQIRVRFPPPLREQFKKFSDRKPIPPRFIKPLSIKFSFFLGFFFFLSI